MDINCVATPHCNTILKEHIANDFYSHTLNLGTNLKHYAHRVECYYDIVRMAKKIRVVESREEMELFEEVLAWLEQNQTLDFASYVNSCRKWFEELI